MKHVKYWGKWTFSYYKIGNGSKQFGLTFWWNDQRVALEANLFLWNLQAMREWR